MRHNIFGEYPIKETSIIKTNPSRKAKDILRNQYEIDVALNDYHQKIKQENIRLKFAQEALDKNSKRKPSPVQWPIWSISSVLSYIGYRQFHDNLGLSLACFGLAGTFLAFPYIGILDQKRYERIFTSHINESKNKISEYETEISNLLGELNGS